MDAQAMQREFLARIDLGGGIAGLFDHLPQVHLFVKDCDSRFMKVNGANLRLLGAVDEVAVIGKNDWDFFAPAVADKYIEEDRQVMRSGQPSVNTIWLVPNSDGLLAWYLCTKIPLYDREGRVAGLAGTLVDYKYAGVVLEPYEEMAGIVNYINCCYGQELSVERLAERVHLSVSQFERRFKGVFQIGPLRYLIKVRINAACRLLCQSNLPITRIALETGFCDHSYFTRKFKELLGLTPMAYRRRYVEPHPAGVEG